MGSLEEDFLYALMGTSNLMLYPYITLILSVLFILAPLAGSISPQFQ